MSDDGELPEDAINLTVPLVVCPIHGEPFRTRWPLGYPVFMLEAFNLVLGKEAREEVHEQLWEDAKRALGIGELAGVEAHVAVEAALRTKPLCCRLSPQELLKLYARCEVGTLGRCSVCGKRRVSGTTWAGLLPTPHVCFRCVVHRIRLFRPN